MARRFAQPLCPLILRDSASTTPSIYSNALRTPQAALSLEYGFRSRNGLSSRYSTESSSIGLGTRSTLPPDIPRRQAPLPYSEWEMQTGRAISTLTRTLPSFFETGLVDTEKIYSPKIRLTYSPPPPFPKNLMVEGLPIYIGTSMLVRHTFNMLYSDVKVVVKKVEVEPKTKEKVENREKKLWIGMTIHATARLTGADAVWDVSSTYSFSPNTGLIHTHTINSIEPAPHVAVWEALRERFLRLGGVEGELAYGPTTEP
ncbi:hypothetical protein C8J56DRAFT_846870 [Mycena floridula]|nr:hypothetical protein C8J56DRAFT_846870 [Mycena floridula]